MAIGMWNYRKAVILSKQLDFFEMQELNEGTPFYNQVLKERVVLIWKHDYEGTNWSIIVEVIFDDLPPFIDGIKKIYEKM